MTVKLDDRNLYLVGFMASGKTDTSVILGPRMKREIRDTDARIVELMGMPISDIFDRYGEAHFRHIETDIVLEAYRQRQRKLIVSTGGGAFCQSPNRDLMLESGVVVWLDVELPIIRERLKDGTDRPFARDPARMEALYWERRPLYGRAHHRVHIGVEVPAEEVAERVLHAIGWE